MNKFNKFNAVLIIIALVSGFLGGLLSGELKNKGADEEKVIEERTYVEESSLISAIEKVSPAVVSIVATKDLDIYYNQPNLFFNDPFFQQFFQMPEQNNNQGEKRTEKKQVSGGTGFVLTEDGILLTNKHVVLDDEADYTVVLSNGTEFKGEILGKDPLNDVAVMQLKDKKTNEKPKGLKVAEIGDSDKIKIGQKVLAIGNALAEYQNTVTEGIISAKGREVDAGGGGFSESLSGLFQTDAAINPGNSGGPLVNLDGEVIGVNTAIAGNATGIGFAIPINDAKQVIDSIKKTGKIVRPQLGVRHMILTEEKAKELKLEGVTYGALLARGQNDGEFAVIPGSAADKAGLKEGDVILEVEGQKITVDNQLQQIIRKYQPGDKLKLKIWSSGEEKEISITLSEAK